MTTPKVSCITKLEGLGYIQLSKSFFMRDFYPHPPCEAVLLIPEGEGALIKSYLPL